MRNVRYVVVSIIVAVMLGFAAASVSLSTGAVLPGWDQVRSGDLYRSAGRLLQDYARQAGVSCGLYDVHMKTNASLLSRQIHVDTWFEGDYVLTDLLTARNQHVVLLSGRSGMGGEHLLLIAEADRTLLLAAC